MKIFRITGLFFLLYLLGMSGCSKAVPVWENLYRTDSADMEGSETSSEEALTETAEKLQNLQETEGQETTASIYVYMCGAVENPGVYELQKGDRVNQAIEAAGGLTEDADLLLVNQAKVVEDGEQIRIYTKKEAADVEIQAIVTDGTSAAAKVNINVASAETLMTLPGIGEAKAAAIIEYRESNGAFQVIDDIMNIPGIKEAVFSKIKNKITV